MFRSFIAATLLLAGLAQAGLSDMRGTIPGSLHQCQNISVFFFDTDDAGAKTLLFVNAADSAKLGTTGTLTLSDALSKTTPLQTISNIDSADAASFPFLLKVEENTSFSTFGFLSNGQGKNLNLDRTVKAPLPGAVDCMSTVSASPATVASVAAVVSSSAASASAPAPTSGFVKALKASSSSASVTPPSSSVPSTPPPAVSSPAVSSVASAAVAVASANVSSSAVSSKPSSAVIETKYLLSSFIKISAEQTTDGIVSSAAILGGHITGNYNGTILAVGSALFAPNTTAPVAGATVGNTTVNTQSNSKNATTSQGGEQDDNAPILISATYTFTIDDGKNAGDAVFVMAQTPLSVNGSVPALLMHLQPATTSIGSKWANKTVLGKPTYINSTMFRIDAYVA